MGWQAILSRRELQLNNHGTIALQGFLDEEVVSACSLYEEYTVLVMLTMCKLVTWSAQYWHRILAMLASLAASLCDIII